MKLAITGATGFIGKHLLKKLESSDIDISIAVRNVEAVQLPNKNIRLVRMDISSPPNNAYEILGSPDILIHLAWGGLPQYLSFHHFESELPLQYKFIKGLVHAGLRNLLITGTCFEYGMQSGELNESAIAMPENPYGFAKVTLLNQLKYLQTEIPFSLIWARLFYMYGFGQSEFSLMSQLNKAVLSGEKVFKMSGGEQLRDFLPVEEVAERLLFLAKTKKNIGVVNICSGIPISIRRFVELQIKKNEWKIDLDLGHYPYAAYEPMAFWGAPYKFDSLIQRVKN